MSFSWQRVIIVVAVVGAAVGAFALGGSELAASLAGLAAGILVPTSVQAK